MIANEKVNNYPAIFLENKEFAMVYFQEKDVGEYNINKLTELQSNLERVKKFYNKMSLLLSVTRFFKIENLINITSKVENQHKKVINSARELDVFEFDLTFLIVSGILDIERVKKLGFDEEYINGLLSRLNTGVSNPYNEEYDDETSKVIEDEKKMVLSHTPYAVDEKNHKK